MSAAAAGAVSTVSTAAVAAAAAAGTADGFVAALSEEVVVDASPAAAIRQHVAKHRHDLQRASAMAQGLAQDEISNAPAERSELTAMIVGAMQPPALVALLRSLLQATRQPEWHCPQLVFILPPGAAALRQRILKQHWPPQVQARAEAEPLACAASVWNCVLEAWGPARTRSGRMPRTRRTRPPPQQTDRASSRCHARAGRPARANRRRRRAATARGWLAAAGAEPAAGAAGGQRWPAGLRHRRLGAW